MRASSLFAPAPIARPSNAPGRERRHFAQLSIRSPKRAIPLRAMPRSTDVKVRASARSAGRSVEVMLVYYADFIFGILNSRTESAYILTAMKNQRLTFARTIERLIVGSGNPRAIILALQGAESWVALNASLRVRQSDQMFRASDGIKRRSLSPVEQFRSSLRYSLPRP